MKKLLGMIILNYYYLDCENSFMVLYICLNIKLYILNMFNLLYVNYTLIRHRKEEKEGRKGRGREGGKEKKIKIVSEL